MYFFLIPDNAETCTVVCIVVNTQFTIMHNAQKTVNNSPFGIDLLPVNAKSVVIFVKVDKHAPVA